MQKKSKKEWLFGGPNLGRAKPVVLTLGGPKVGLADVVGMADLGVYPAAWEWF